MKDLEALSCNVCPRVGGRAFARKHQCHSLVRKPGTDQHMKYYSRVPPLCAHPLSIVLVLVLGGNNGLQATETNYDLKVTKTMTKNGQATTCLAI